MSDKTCQHKIHDFYHRIFYRVNAQLNASLIVLLFALNTIPTTANQFYCFDPMDRKELKYSNVQNKSIDELPTIRFIQGFWDSQWYISFLRYSFKTNNLLLCAENTAEHIQHNLLNSIQFIFQLRQNVIDHENII